MSFFRYALLDIVRGRRRTFSAILGIVLAITFLAGTYIAIDSSTRATLEGMLAGVNGDFTVGANRGSASDLQQILQVYPGVVDSAVFYRGYVGDLGTGGEITRVGAETTFVDPEKLPRIWRDAEVVGSLELPRGTVALTQSLASFLDIGIGENVTLVNFAWDPVDEEPVTYQLNLTVEALVTMSRPSEAAPFGPVFWYDEWVVLMHIRDVEWIGEQLSLSPGYARLAAEVWVDRGRFINPYDIESSRRELARFERGLEQALVSFNASVSDNVSFALSLYETQITSQRVIYLILSAPVLLLGLYLGAVGVDLGHAERRRELAVLKTRGAGGGQVLGLLLLGAVLSGILATAIGLVAGIGLSRLLLTVVNPFALEVAPAYDVIVLSVGTVITVAAFSVVFMLLASYRSAKRTAKLPVAETLRYYAPGETKIDYRPTIDIVLVSLGIIALAGTWFVRFNPGNFVSFLVGIIFTVLLPLAPVFLIVGATRLLTRSTGRIYGWAARLWKPIAGGLHSIINKNLARNPRRSSNVAVIIALGLAFGLFIFAFLGSTVANQQRTIRASIGADINVRTAPLDDASFLQNLSSVPQVSGISVVRVVYAEVYGRGVQTYGVDPDTLFAVTQPESWYFDGMSAEAAADAIRGEDQVLTSKAMADSLFLEVGDRIPITQEYYNETAGRPEDVTVNVTVAGIVRALPGTVEYTYTVPSALYASHETLAPFIEREDGFFGEGQILVDLQPGADWREAKGVIVAMGVSYVQVYEEELLRATSDPFYRSVLGFISMEVAFIVAILTAGLGLILFAATLERDVEFAAIRARGASGWQASGLITGEASSIMIVGLVIGTVVGLVVAYFIFQVFIISFGPQEPLVPFLFALPLEGVLLVVITPIAMLLTALLIAWRVARMNVARVLKLRGG